MALVKSGRRDVPTPESLADQDDDGVYCATCGGAMDWEDCQALGCDDGLVEHLGDAEEPWDSLETCEECDGKGGWWWCHHPHEGDDDEEGSV